MTIEELSLGDGPHRDVAEAFLVRGICERCWTDPPVDDDLCTSCCQDLLIGRKTISRLRQIPR